MDVRNLVMKSAYANAPALPPIPTPGEVEGRPSKSGKGCPRNALCFCLGEKLSSLETTTGVTPVKTSKFLMFDFNYKFFQKYILGLQFSLVCNVFCELLVSGLFSNYRNFTFDI